MRVKVTTEEASEKVTAELEKSFPDIEQPNM